MEIRLSKRAREQQPTALLSDRYVVGTLRVCVWYVAHGALVIDCAMVMITMRLVLVLEHAKKR